MDLDIPKIYKELEFLNDSLRLQYTNFIWRNRDRFNSYLSFDDAVYRLRLGEPIEYVFNLAEFYQLKLYVDKRCLIPRFETEEIVKLTLDFINEKKFKDFNIVDVGTGSGCISLALANELEKINLNNFKIIGIDSSDDALEVARINRTKLNFVNKIILINSEFQEFNFTNLSNLIVCSNLPYIPDNESVQKSVFEYEPHTALFGGKNGNELNLKLLQKLESLNNLKAIFMEGYNGEITIKYF